MATEHQKQEIAALREMMGTDGWRVFMREMSKDKDRLNNGVLTGINNANDLFFCKGMDEILRRITNYDKLIDAAEFSEEG